MLKVPPDGTNVSVAGPAPVGVLLSRKTPTKPISRPVKMSTEIAFVPSAASNASAAHRGHRRLLYPGVQDGVCRGWLDAELAKHAHDLATVQRTVIYYVHDDLPGGKAGITHEAGFEGHLPSHIGIRGCV